MVVVNEVARTMGRRQRGQLENTTAADRLFTTWPQWLRQRRLSKWVICSNWYRRCSMFVFFITSECHASFRILFCVIQLLSSRLLVWTCGACCTRSHVPTSFVTHWKCWRNTWISDINRVLSTAHRRDSSSYSSIWPDSMSNSIHGDQVCASNRVKLLLIVSNLICGFIDSRRGGHFAHQKLRGQLSGNLEVLLYYQW